MYYVLEHFAVAVCAITGVLAARGKQLDLFGVVVLALVLGVLTGVAGGMLRDVLTGEIPLVFRKEIYLYATASLCGALLFVLLEQWRPSEPQNRLLAIGLTLGLRLAAMRWKIALPLFEPPRA